MSHGSRIVGYDVARALAVFGMVIVNYGIVMGAYQDKTHWLSLMAALFEGRAAATFVVLAGVGLSLLTRRARTSGDAVAMAGHRTSIIRRATFLFIFGLIYTPLWPADILHFYGIYIAIGALLLTSSRFRLGAVAVGTTLLFPILVLFLDYERGWDWTTLRYEGLWTAAGFLRNLFFNGFHPVIPWISFLLIGMIIGRLDLRRTDIRRRLLFLCVGAMVLAETGSAVILHSLSGAVSNEERELITFFFMTDPMPPMPLYILAGAGMAGTVIGLCVALTERFPDARAIRPFIETGQLALTLYFGHVVVGMGVLEGIGRLENQSAPFAMTSALLFCVFGIIFAFLWKRQFRHGPVEWLLRRIAGS